MPHALEGARRDVEVAGARLPDPAQRQVAPRLLGGPQAVDRAEVVVGPRRQVGRVALDQVHEPEEGLAALAVEPDADRVGGLAGAVVGLRPERLARPARAVADRPAVEVRLAPGPDVAKLVEPEAEARLDRHPEVRAERAGLVSVRAQHVGEEAVAIGRRGPRGPPAASPRAGRGCPVARGSRPVNIEACDGSVQQAGACTPCSARPRRARSAIAGRRAGRGAVRLEGVGARRVEDDEQDVREHVGAAYEPSRPRQNSSTSSLKRSGCSRLLMWPASGDHASAGRRGSRRASARRRRPVSGRRARPRAAGSGPRSARAGLACPPRRRRERAPKAGGTEVREDRGELVDHPSGARAESSPGIHCLDHLLRRHGRLAQAGLEPRRRRPQP